jgi:hypothetical protein
MHNGLGLHGVSFVANQSKKQKEITVGFRPWRKTGESGGEAGSRRLSWRGNVEELNPDFDECDTKKRSIGTAFD